MAQPGCCVSQLGAPGQCRVAAPGPLSSAGPRPCASLASAGCSRRLLQPLGQPRAFAAAPRRRLGGFSSVVRADAGEAGIEGYSLPLPERKVLTRKAKRRIVREGPREQDLRDESGRIVKEVLPGASELAYLCIMSALCAPGTQRCGQPVVHMCVARVYSR